MANSQKFLVLGANSFSGAFFCEHLASQGIDVLATSRSKQPHRAFLPYKWNKTKGSVHFKRVDLNKDLGALELLLRAERPTHIVNFAAQSMVGESWLYPDHWMMTNVVSTIRLHELLRRYDGLERYVHVTTPEVYGSTDGWVKEGHPFNPSTPYAVSRAASDMSLKTYFDQYEFPVVFTRAANVYGPGQQLYRIIPRTIYAAMTGQKLKLDGGGKSVRVFIHMRDVSDATQKIAINGSVGDTYHISGYELVSIRRCVEMILSKLNKNFEECVEVGPERPGKDTAYTLDSFKLRTELGWQDKVSLSDGIGDTIEWTSRFMADIPNLPTKYSHKA
jgi:dTDP-glucose 4,6-dehydratase